MSRKRRSRTSRGTKSRPRPTPDAQAPPRRLPLSRWKLTLFSLLVLFAFFVALELLLAGLGVKPALYDDDPYVGFASSVPLFVGQTAPDGSSVLVTASNKLRLFNPQQFPASKTSDAYRIFCVGGSTTYGRPYGDVTSFCGWLRELLPVADPSRHWEVINAGGVSYASYRTALLMEELCQYDPDLFIIYSGHNEFLEQRTYGEIIRAPRAVRGLGAIASQLRAFTLMRRAFEFRDREPTESEGGPVVLDEEVRTLLDGSIGPDAYTRDDAFRAQVLRHYRFSLARIVDMARAAGAQAVLVTPASNLRSFSPFKSEHVAALGEGELQTWDKLWNLAKTAGDQGRWQDALAALDQAVAIDPRHADTQHLRGQALDALKRYAEAKSAFVRARDEDVCPLRALTPAREIVLQVAAGRGVPLVDFETLVERRSPQGIPGENLFLDHVHPTIEGNRLLAVALIEALEEQAIVKPQPSWDEAAIRRVTELVEGRLDKRAHGFALMNLSKVLGWAGNLEEARKLSLRAIELAPAEAPVVYQAALCAHFTGRTEAAIRLYRKTVEIAPGMATAHGNLGVLLGEHGRRREAAVHLRRAITLVGNRNIPYRNSLAETLEGLGNDMAEAVASTETQTAALGERFGIKIDESVLIEGEALQIGFVDVPTDSRCPTGEQCISEGDAIVRIWAQQASKARKEYELHTSAKEDRAVIYIGYQVQLLELTPYPVSGQAIEPEGYEASLRVTLGSSPPSKKR